ncbi:hypothetical protein D3C76_1555230 [compost metagenome]
MCQQFEQWRDQQHAQRQEHEQAQVLKRQGQQRHAINQLPDPDGQNQQQQSRQPQRMHLTPILIGTAAWQWVDGQPLVQDQVVDQRGADQGQEEFAHEGAEC